MNNYKKVFRIFKNNYRLVPLEVFKNDSYKCLISTMLSARARDSVTILIAKNLFKKAPTVEKLSNLTLSETEKEIKAIGLFRTKAKNILQTAKIIVEKYDKKVPNTREELMSLPGVGRKTANLVLNRAFNKPAIAVDIHVHRISNLLGWVNTNTPEKTENKLMELLPKKYWSEVNNLFVSIGQQYTSKSKLIEFLEKNKLINSQE